jgi:tRNA dimethylallyltransferase
MPDSQNIDLLCLLGPTASGKTELAAGIARELNGEIISADSRQVYREMNIGTGKDLNDYVVDGIVIPYHLIDIVDPGYEYNVYSFQRDFLRAYEGILKNERLPLLCGGSGLYIEAVLKAYRLISVPPDENLRKELETMTMTDLEKMLRSFRKLHNTTDTATRKRLIRAIEIETYYQSNPTAMEDYPKIRSLILGVYLSREEIKKRITRRLVKRLKGGMIQEVEGLLSGGLTPDQLIYYGLEYKYITLYLTGQIKGYDEMFRRLNIAIHQFAKRQMTWFRKMEREGFRIHWLDGTAGKEENIRIVRNLMGSYQNV